MQEKERRGNDCTILARGFGLVPGRAGVGGRGGAGGRAAEEVGGGGGSVPGGGGGGGDGSPESSGVFGLVLGGDTSETSDMA